MAVWNGIQSVKSNERTRYDPQAGETRTIEYTGTKKAMYGIQTTYRVQYPVVGTEAFHIGGSVWKCVVTIPFWFNASPSQVTTEWETDTEAFEKDIFRHPTVQQDVIDQNTTASEWRKAVEAAVETEGATAHAAAIAALTTTQQSVAVELGRGVTGYEDEYQTLTRTRRASSLYPFSYVVRLGLARVVFSVAQLQLPSNLGFLTGSLPAQPPSTYWGWRMRDQRVRIVGDKVEEVVTFVLSDWSSFLYTQSTANFV